MARRQAPPQWFRVPSDTYFNAGALENLRTSLDVYAEMIYEHMRKEETLLEDSRVVLPDEEWRAIAGAFRADEDPLFGTQRRREFALLHHRICAEPVGCVERGRPDDRPETARVIAVCQAPVSARARR